MPAPSNLTHAPVGVRILTVSRRFGAGGGELARAVGDRLGWRVLDREVVQKIAAELRVPEEEVEARDERVRGLAERVGEYLANTFPEMVPPPLPPTRVDDETLRVLCESVLREAARLPPVVIVGHGAQCLFADRPDAVHVRVVAPLEARVARMARRTDRDPAAVEEEARARDEARARYLHHHYGADWEDPTLYHLVVNAGRIPLPEAAALVVRVVEGRGEPGS